MRVEGERKGVGQGFRVRVRPQEVGLHQRAQPEVEKHLRKRALRVGFRVRVSVRACVRVRVRV